MRSKLNVVVLLTLAAFGTASAAFAEASRKPSRQSAGHLEVKGSQKGLIAIVNGQSRVSAKDLEAAAAVIVKQTMCRAEVCDGKGAQVVIEVVDRKGESALTVCPEDHKATVNVDGLVQGLSGDAVGKFLATRCRREILRAFCYACGAAGSQFPNNIMSISKIADLDLINGDFIPGDTATACQKRLKDIGVTPKQYVPYFAACRQGWAPAPTNDIQKAIWDKVHAMPTAPIKIKPEAKKVAE